MDGNVDSIVHDPKSSWDSVNSLRDPHVLLHDEHERWKYFWTTMDFNEPHTNKRLWWNGVGNVRNIITGLRNQANDSLNKYDLCAWLHIEWSLHGVLATCNMPIISSEWLGSAKHSKVRGGKYWHMRCKTQQNVWVGLTVISLFLQNGTTHSKWMCDTRQPHTKVTSPYSQQYFEGNTFSGTTQIWRNTLMFEI